MTRHFLVDRCPRVGDEWESFLKSLPPDERRRAKAFERLRRAANEYAVEAACEDVVIDDDPPGVYFWTKTPQAWWADFAPTDEHNMGAGGGGSPASLTKESAGSTSRWLDVCRRLEEAGFRGAASAVDQARRLGGRVNELERLLVWALHTHDRGREGGCDGGAPPE